MKLFVFLTLNRANIRQIRRLIASLFLMLFSHVSLLHAQSVRLIYFYPTDHAAPNQQKMDECGKIAREAQSFYRKQMLDNGFGDKTFELEGIGESITIYSVMGSRDTQHYATNRWEQIITEISGVKSDINLILVEGLEVLTNNIGAVMVRSCSGNKCTTDHHTFYAIVPLKTAEPVVGASHELGHAFGLQHNRDNDSLMVGTRQVDGKHPTIASMYLRDYERRWLDKHKYFNNAASVNDPPVVRKIWETKWEDDDEVGITLRIDIESNYELHQAQLMFDGTVIDSDALMGLSDNVYFHFTKHQFGSQRVDMQFIDTDGNIRYVDNVRIKEPEETDREYVTLKEKSSNHSMVVVGWASMKRGD